MTSEADLWALFAAAKMAAGRSAEMAAVDADAMLAEFDARFTNVFGHWFRREVVEEPAPSPESDEPRLDLG